MLELEKPALTIILYIVDLVKLFDLPRRTVQLKANVFNQLEIKIKYS